MTMTLVFTQIGTFSLVFLLCLLCLQSDGADIGENCTVDGNCTYDNGTCVDSTCGCVATHYIHEDGDKVCQLKKMALSGSEWDSIQQIGERDDIIIKPVDKESANKIMHELTFIHEK